MSRDESVLTDQERAERDELLLRTYGYCPRSWVRIRDDATSVTFKRSMTGQIIVLRW